MVAGGECSGDLPWDRVRHDYQADPPDCVHVQGGAKFNSTAIIITKMDNQEWLKNVSAMMNCPGTQEDPVKLWWDVVTMLTNHAMVRGIMNSLRVKS